MKKSVLYLIVLFVLLSCKKSSQDTIANDKTWVTQESLNYLTTNGFDVKHIEITADKVVIEGDIVIERSDLIERVKTYNEAGKKLQTSQRRTAFSVNDDRINGIGIYIEPTVPSVWIDALEYAISEYGLTANNGGRLRFIRIFEPADADIVVGIYYAAFSNVIAQAIVPTSLGLPGNRIEINTFYQYNNNITYSQMRFAMIHEIGHTIGLHHTDDMNQILISGTPTTDGASYMNSVVANYNGFSLGDKQALVSLYPLPVQPSQSPKIFGPSQISSSQTGYFVFSQHGTASTTYEWEIVDFSYGGISDGRTQDIYGAALPAGSYTIRGRAFVNNTFTPWAYKSFTKIN